MISIENTNARIPRTMHYPYFCGRFAQKIITNQDKLELEKIYTQVKSYNKSKVREKDIRNFIGAMSGYTTKEVFFITSTFDDSAIKKASDAHHTIILIDGSKLVNLMYQYNVGIQIKTVYEVKELDNDFFEGG